MIGARASISRRLARARLLDPCAEGIKRLELRIEAAVDAKAYQQAKRLLGYRRMLSAQIDDSPSELAGIDELDFELDVAIANRRRVAP